MDAFQVCMMKNLENINRMHGSIITLETGQSFLASGED